MSARGSPLLRFVSLHRFVICWFTIVFQCARACLHHSFCLVRESKIFSGKPSYFWFEKVRCWSGLKAMTLFLFNAYVDPLRVVSLRTVGWVDKGSSLVSIENVPISMHGRLL